MFRPILDTPPSDDQAAVKLATTKCQAWGFTSASAFGGETKTCNSTTMHKDGSQGCTRWLIQKSFQCEN
ncbi:hypothetical protein G3447_10570 [Shewanella baltica]|nr:hypothetical protein [Shewanella baltica]